MSKPKVLIVGSQHGNEVLGDDLYDYISNNYSEYLEQIEYICANPDAHRDHVRFIETDMNRSYKTGGDSYEENRANAILDTISKNNYKYVLDVHTTTADIGGVFVSVNLNAANTKIIRASKIVDIIIMPSEIAKNSLIGNVESSISIEYNENLATEKTSLEDLSRFVINLIEGIENIPVERRLYPVDGFIQNDEGTKDLKNFELSPQGYYPILIGEVNYTRYRGFKASQQISQVI